MLLTIDFNPISEIWQKKAEERRRARPPRPKTPRLPTDPRIKFLKPHIWQHNYAHVVDGQLRPRLRADTVKTFINHYGRGATPNNTEWRAHLEGESPIYIASNPNKTAPYALICIDVDVLKSKGLGSKEGGEKCASDLNKEFGYLPESSTHGNGQHLWGRLFKLHRTAKEVKHALAHLQAYLQARQHEWDVEGLETKGQPPEIERDDTGKITDIIFPQWIKAPRIDIGKAPVFSIEEILALKIPQTSTATKHYAGSCSPIGPKQIQEFSRIVQSFREKRLHYHCYAQRLPCPRKIYADHFAYGVGVLWLAMRVKRRQGQMPNNLIESIWRQLYQQGHLPYYWHNQIWKGIRNTLADCGYLDFVSNEYWFDPQRPGEGMAMRFGLARWLMEALDTNKDTHTYMRTLPTFQQCRWRPKHVVHPDLIGHRRWFRPEFEAELDKMLA